jgi:hypothetical protein
MGEITTVGLDLAKSVFQVHAVDAEGRVAIRRQVRRPNLGGSLQACRPARSAWKPARPPTTGPASSLLSAMRSGSCPRPM